MNDSVLTRSIKLAIELVEQGYEHPPVSIVHVKNLDILSIIYSFEHEAFSIDVVVFGADASNWCIIDKVDMYKGSIKKVNPLLQDVYFCGTLVENLFETIIELGELYACRDSL